MANPDNNFIQYDMDSSKFSRLPSKIAHRPAVFHSFIPKTEEQYLNLIIILLSAGWKQ